MTTNQKLPGKSRPAASREPISIQAEIADDYQRAVAEPVAPETPAAEQVAAEPVELKAAAVSVTATLGELPSLKTSEEERSGAEFDPRAWSLKTLDLFSENAAAILDFTAALMQAKSLTDAIELQSRFARERYSTLLRQTNEVAELTRRITLDPVAPVRLSFRAFAA
jgi:hypothetical protein